MEKTHREPHTLEYRLEALRLMTRRANRTSYCICLLTARADPASDQTA